MTAVHDHIYISFESVHAALLDCLQTTVFESSFIFGVVAQIYTLYLKN